MIGKRMWGAVAIVALAFTGTTRDLRAQAAGVDVRIQRAEVLADYALQVAKQRQDFREAASLLREAAQLRGTEAEAARELVQAGHFAYYAGLGLQAVSALRSAAEVALATGDEQAAIEAYFDAAWVAQQEGETATARELLLRGEHLAVQAQLDAEVADRTDATH